MEDIVAPIDALDERRAIRPETKEARQVKGMTR